MSFLDSIKSHMGGAKREEQEFERAFREGRYPEGVDDFEPLSNTGNFIAPEELLHPESQLAPGESAPFAPVSEVADTGQARPVAAQPAARERRGQGEVVQFTPRTAPAEELTAEEDVRVIERDEGAPRTPAARPQARSFADRLQDRVAAAAPETVRQAPSADVDDADLDAELSRRRRANEAAREERREREEARRRASDEEVARVRERAAQRDEAPAAAPASQGERQPAGFVALPTKPVVLRVRSYDDVSKVAEAVMAKHQPVVLFMRGTSSEITRRVLDFSFGLCCGTQAKLSQMEERVYVVTPRGTSIGDRDKASLRRQGILRS